MNLFSIDFSLNELAFIRQALEGVTIKGADAKFLANLQNKLEYEINQIQQVVVRYIHLCHVYAYFLAANNKVYYKY